MNIKILFICTLLCVLVTTNANKYRQFMFKSNGFEDITWSSPIFDIVTISKAQCLMKCSLDFNCKTFTFTKGTNRCQGHSRRKGQNDQPVTTADTSVYQGLTDFCFNYWIIQLLIDYCWLSTFIINYQLVWIINYWFVTIINYWS